MKPDHNSEIVFTVPVRSLTILGVYFAMGFLFAIGFDLVLEALNPVNHQRDCGLLAAVIVGWPAFAVMGFIFLVSVILGSC